MGPCEEFSQGTLSSLAQLLGKSKRQSLNIRNRARHFLHVVMIVGRSVGVSS